ncbi:MAG: hypothetical protein ACRYFU_04440, partial [Janthinobacterium lividum]
MTLSQKTNVDGFPKAGELIEITGTSSLEASDRTILNLLYQHAHDSGHFAEPRTAFEVSITDLLPSSHVGTERVRDSIARLLTVQVRVPIKHPRTGKPAILQTPLLHSVITPDKAEPG